MTSNEVIMQLLREIGDLGTQDLYTDAEEYAGRTEAMHDLSVLAGEVIEGKEVRYRDVTVAAGHAKADYDTGEEIEADDRGQLQRDDK